jgi:hypothetical protein
VVLGNRERDPLERRQIQLAVAQLRTEARVRTQRRRRAGEHAEEVRQLSAAGQRAAENRRAAFRRGLFVMDLEPALLIGAVSMYFISL